MESYYRFGGIGMKSYLTAVRLATKLQMLRSGKKRKTLIVVEGITDFRLYSKLFDEDISQVIVGESKQNVLGALEICEGQELKGVIGIVDADFWHIEKEIELPANIFMTDTHDLETMLMNSKAYHNILLEYSDPNKLARFERTQKQKLEEVLLESSSTIGYLRRLSLNQNLELDFSELNFYQFIKIETLQLQEEAFIRYMIFKSKRNTLKKVRVISELLHEQMKQEEDLWQVCCGHDIMALLTLGFVHLFGNYNAGQMIAGQLEGSFRLAYQEADFEKTQLYEALRNWEKIHTPYQIFTSKQQEEVI